MVRNLTVPAATASILAGYVSRWDASDAASITSSSNAVSQWTDSSGNAIHFTQATGANQPLTATDTIGGLNAIKFDGSTSYMETASVNPLNQPATLFIVVKTLRAASAQESIFMPNSDQPGRIYRTAAGNFATYAGTVLDSTIASGTTNAHVVSVVCSGASSKIAVDGTTTTGNEGTGNGSPAKWRVGGNANGGEFVQADVGEIVVYATALSDSDRQSVEAFLKAKWSTP